MSGLYYVNTACLRYIIPFQFESFDEACAKVEDQKEEIWKRNKETKEKQPSGEYRHFWQRIIATQDGPESDLYGYIRNEFRFDDALQSLSEQKTGCQWLFWRSDRAPGKDGKKIKNLYYFSDGLAGMTDQLPEKWEIAISNVGLSLYRNGLGFLWYEFDLGKTQKDSDQLKLFQNTIRELNRSEVSPIWEISNTEPEYGLVISEKKGHKRYMSPFSIGNWIRESLDFLEVKYFAERKNSYEKMLQKSMAVAEKSSFELVYQDDVREMEQSDVPDKGILFSYISLWKKDGVDDRLWDRQSFAFHITNGYKDTFHFSDESASKMKRPFDDVLWYATQEGASYLVWPGNDNEEVFKTLILSKIKTDYFTLYLKILYQSYSLLLYAERIQSEISAVVERIRENPLNRDTEDLFLEIHLFLTKGMATSVSHIHHQSEFYLYLEKQLRVKEDVDSVTAGLNVLDVLQKERREVREKKNAAKIQAIMGLFALLGLSSALVDCFDFISEFSAIGNWQNLSTRVQIVELLFMLIITIIGMLAVFFAVKALVEAFKK